MKRLSSEMRPISHTFLDDLFVLSARFYSGAAGFSHESKFSVDLSFLRLEKLKVVILYISRVNIFTANLER